MGRRGALALAAGVGWLGAASAVLAYFGVGGYRGGFYITLVVLLAGVAASLLWLPENRMLYGVAFALVAVTLASVVRAHSPPSAGRLSERLDAVDLPYYHRISQHTVGSSTCSPRCPGIVRVYLGPNTGTRAALVNTAVGLDQRHLLAPPRLRRPFRDPRIDERVDDVRVRVDVAKRADGRILLTVRLDATR